MWHARCPSQVDGYGVAPHPFPFSSSRIRRCVTDEPVANVVQTVEAARGSSVEGERDTAGGGTLPVVEVVYRASIETRHSVVFATVIVALVLLP
jgi:hypothetical protein